MSDTKVKRIISDLIESNYIRREGSNKSWHWIILDDWPDKYHVLAHLIWADKWPDKWPDKLKNEFLPERTIGRIQGCVDMAEIGRKAKKVGMP